MSDILRELWLRWRLRVHTERAEYCRAMRRQAEACIAEHDARAESVRIRLFTLKRREALR